MIGSNGPCPCSSLRSSHALSRQTRACPIESSRYDTEGWAPTPHLLRMSTLKPLPTAIRKLGPPNSPNAARVMNASA